jgi:hypothetical protein
MNQLNEEVTWSTCGENPGQEAEIATLKLAHQQNYANSPRRRAA